MKVYASFTDLVAQEVRPALRTDESLTDEQVDQLAPEVAQRLQDDGLIVWDDGWSEARQAYWLPAQGFRMVETDDGSAAFWGNVSDVLTEKGGVE